MTSVSTSHGTSATNLKSAAAPSQAPNPHTPSRSGPAPTAPAPNATPASKVLPAGSSVVLEELG
jgi:hypothetical protein